MTQAVTWSTLDDFLETWGETLDVGLGNHDISHIAFWKGRTYDTVPEPATKVHPVKTQKKSDLILKSY